MLLQGLHISLIINSFNNINSESKQSSEMMDYLKNRKIKINDIKDINQEMNFESDTKLTKNIRVLFHKTKKIYKINFKYPIPQLILNKETVITYPEFKNLIESHPKYLSNVLNQKFCHHMRFENSELVYPKLDSNDDLIKDFCIYCYSNKKINKCIKLFTDVRNTENNDLNAEILSYLEDNDITFEYVDIENLVFYNITTFPSFIQKKFKEYNFDSNNNYNADYDNEKKFFFIKNKEKNYEDNDDYSYFILDNFFEVIEKKNDNKMNNNNQELCTKCGKTITMIGGIANICIDCCIADINNKNSQSYNNNMNFTNCMNYSCQNYLLTKMKKNPYNFIEKLKLKKLDDLGIINENDSSIIASSNEKVFNISVNESSQVPSFKKIENNVLAKKYSNDMLNSNTSNNLKPSLNVSFN